MIGNTRYKKVVTLEELDSPPKLLGRMKLLMLDKGWDIVSEYCFSCKSGLSASWEFSFPIEDVADYKMCMGVQVTKQNNVRHFCGVRLNNGVGVVLAELKMFGRRFPGGDRYTKRAKNLMGTLSTRITKLRYRKVGEKDVLAYLMKCARVQLLPWKRLGEIHRLATEENQNRWGVLCGVCSIVDSYRPHFQMGMKLTAKRLLEERFHAGQPRNGEEDIGGSL